VADRVARLLWLATVVWVATHPTGLGLALVVAATSFLMWATTPGRADTPSTGRRGSQRSVRA
jgi:hypothetical protein